MKKIVARVLCFLFLFHAIVPAQGKEQLAKLPALLEHYIQHNAESPGITFFDFFKLHYGEEFAQHHSEHNHSGLPGKVQSYNLHISFPIILPATVFSAPAVQLMENAQPLFEDQSYTFIFLQDIWQPPRAV